MLFKAGAEMNTIVKLLIMVALFANTAHSGPLAYAICVGGCTGAFIACVAAAGGVAAVASIATTVAYETCMAACVSAGLLPTP
ncbi:hypothetical protein OS493_004348 [Desmophyllum pertusum]|uniref:Uncharacterized protein n=1 Tax=Desmophyllum pertusum TaxID=174260 RepID=A0A9X0D4T7_9CNID|nr:hypothetical protein OS493_004348 [Desmophyllum pertusum]